MSKQIPSFLSGNKCTIKMGNKVIAFAQNISFSDDMQVTPVGMIGAIDYKSLEPTGYMARGSMTITHYSDHVINAIKGAGATAPSDKIFPSGVKGQTDGNSMLISEFFSPAILLISRDFDIEIYERGFGGGGPNTETVNDDLNTKTLIYIIRGVRLNNYSINFSPGTLVNETVSFLARGVSDSRAGETIKD